jgi:hypothetical protein
MRAHLVQHKPCRARPTEKHAHENDVKERPWHPNQYRGETLLAGQRVRGAVLEEYQIRGGVSLHAYDTVNDAQRGVERYFMRCSRNRLHASLNDQTPDEFSFGNLFAQPRQRGHNPRGYAYEDGISEQSSGATEGSPV